MATKLIIFSFLISTPFMALAGFHQTQSHKLRLQQTPAANKEIKALKNSNEGRWRRISTNTPTLSFLETVDSEPDSIFSLEFEETEGDDFAFTNDLPNYFVRIIELGSEIHEETHEDIHERTHERTDEEIGAATDTTNPGISIEQLINDAISESKDSPDHVPVANLKNLIRVVCLIYVVGPGSSPKAVKINGRPNPLPPAVVGTRTHQPIGRCTSTPNAD